MCQGHLLIDGSERETLSKIRKCTDLDEEVIKALKNMKGEKKKSIRGYEWIEEQGLILFRGKVYVLKDEELGKEIMCLHHNTSISGHPGCWMMLELVVRGTLKFQHSDSVTHVTLCNSCDSVQSST